MEITFTSSFLAVILIFLFFIFLCRASS